MTAQTDAGGAKSSSLVCRNVMAEGWRTSMRLEPYLWEALAEICAREGLSQSELVRRVRAAQPRGGRTSATRVFILNYFRQACDARGHRAAGHALASPGSFAPAALGGRRRRAASAA